MRYWMYLGVVAMLAGCGGSSVSSQQAPQSGTPPGTTYTVPLRVNQPAAVAEENLALQMLSVNDSRCPAAAICVWAGHAAVTISVARAGGSSEVIAIGTQAPAGMNLPYQATYQSYRFTLKALDPYPMQQAAPADQYTATVQIEKIAP